MAIDLNSVVCAIASNHIDRAEFTEVNKKLHEWQLQNNDHRRKRISERMGFKSWEDLSFALSLDPSTSGAIQEDLIVLELAVTVFRNGFGAWSSRTRMTPPSPLFSIYYSLNKSIIDEVEEHVADLRILIEASAGDVGVPDKPDNFRVVVNRNGEVFLENDCSKSAGDNLGSSEPESRRKLDLDKLRTLVEENRARNAQEVESSKVVVGQAGEISVVPGQGNEPRDEK